MSVAIDQAPQSPGSEQLNLQHRCPRRCLEAKRAAFLAGGMLHGDEASVLQRRTQSVRPGTGGELLGWKPALGGAEPGPSAPQGDVQGSLLCLIHQHHQQVIALSDERDIPDLHPEDLVLELRHDLIQLLDLEAAGLAFPRVAGAGCVHRGEYFTGDPRAPARAVLLFSIFRRPGLLGLP